MVSGIISFVGYTVSLHFIVEVFKKEIKKNKQEIVVVEVDY